MSNLEKHIPTASNLIASAGIALTILVGFMSIFVIGIKTAGFFGADWSFEFQFHGWMILLSIAVTYIVIRYVLKCDFVVHKRVASR